MKKIFFQFIFLTAIALIVYAIANIGQSYRSADSASLEVAWYKDVENLKSADRLPQYWNSIRIVEKISANNDVTAAKWAKAVSSPIEINPSGEYKLEILFLSQMDTTPPKAVIQYHIIHIPSGNSVWELARIFELK